ncbi:MAG: disulfide bond formation protein B [Gammaproteobacteria bacterium]|nr:disulfide bond formation protein B [Gammaproteobacteria bacterium]
MGFSQRWLFAGGVVLCAGLLATALYFQHVMGLEPCPLCIFQRVFVIVLGILMLIAALHDPGRLWRRVYAAAILIVALLGVAVAGRHVWLQNLPPDQVPECGPGLEYMLDSFPLMQALEMVFKGSGECAEVQWTFLGLSIPAWTLIVFVGIAGVAVFLLVSRRGLPASSLVAQR